MRIIYSKFAFTPMSLASLGLHLLQALAGFALLLLSVWFIAASAIAGVTGMALYFNYVIPSTLIRMLAFTRIGSGYFDKFLGHLGLLSALASVRQRLFAQVLSESTQQTRQTAKTAEQRAAQLQHASETWAAQWNGSWSPLAAAALQLLGMTLVLGILLPSILLSWLCLALAVVLVLAVIYQRARTVQRQVEAEQQAFNREFYQWAQSVSLWSMKPGWSHGEDVKHSAAQYARARHRLEQVNAQGEWWLMVFGVSWALVCCWQWQSVHTGDAIWLIPLIGALTLRDWLAPGLNGAVNLAAVNHAVANMALSPAEPDFDSALAVNENTVSLAFRQYAWQRGNTVGEPLNATLPQTGIVLLEGSSGSGKSSLLAAISGLLPAQGELLVNQQSITELSLASRRALLHHGEQFAHVFSDTLMNNLRLANPAATSEACVAALDWAGLGEFANQHSLGQWVGEAGRPLSGGERKRLILARAYLADAPVWLLDEPFEGLDSAMQEQLADRLSQLAKRRLILVASHTVPNSLTVAQKLHQASPIHRAA